MNRRKKLKQIIKKKDARGKGTATANSNKPKYISKADRAKLAEQHAASGEAAAGGDE
ncbi:hypothetical protein SIN8267_01612 [Sinobacterium norvegicum]|uniref:DUF2986 domain-containing protein n=1 Tax=Sinobacterium norvegicum TaxID=1641715 RepID=A0ABN8EGE8_9GAMM|nr:DUF2986 domain-containing protein [Sinobacterium norvegicum]CAH0991506.1 hypothetical protein SIN8267_01612 [Sinobacterium norvegicum]